MDSARSAQSTCPEKASQKKCQHLCPVLSEKRATVLRGDSHELLLPDLLPAGFVCAERTIAGPLVYGLHKSIFTGGGGAIEDVKTIIQWKEHNGGKAGSMHQIMDLMLAK